MLPSLKFINVKQVSNFVRLLKNDMFSCVGILHVALQNRVMSQLHRAGRSRVTAGVAVSFF